MAQTQRQSSGRNQVRGRAGEEIAQELLEKSGYRIVDVNVRFGARRDDGLIGELDIVAWDGPTLCFVEVKTRRRGETVGSPAEAVTPAKQRQIARLALAYANRHGFLDDGAAAGEPIPLRFDVATVLLPGRQNETPRAELRRGAFLAEGD